MAALSVAIKEALYQRTQLIAGEVRSSTLAVDGWETRAGTRAASIARAGAAAMRIDDALVMKKLVAARPHNTASVTSKSSW